MMNSGGLGGSCGLRELGLMGGWRRWLALVLLNGEIQKGYSVQIAYVALSFLLCLSLSRNHPSIYSSTQRSVHPSVHIPFHRTALLPSFCSDGYTLVAIALAQRSFMKSHPAWPDHRRFTLFTAAQGSRPPMLSLAVPPSPRGGEGVGGKEGKKRGERRKGRREEGTEKKEEDLRREGRLLLLRSLAGVTGVGVSGCCKQWAGRGGIIVSVSPSYVRFSSTASCPSSSVC